MSERKMCQLLLDDYTWNWLAEGALLSGYIYRGRPIRAEFLMALAKKTELVAPVQVTEPAQQATPKHLRMTFDEAWGKLDEDQRSALKWAQGSVKAFYDAVMGV